MMSDTHSHNFFPFQIRTAYELTGETDELGHALYIMVDYMHMTCGCGVAIKTLEGIKHAS